MEQPSLADTGYFTDKGMRRQVNEDSFGVPPADLAAHLLAQKGLLYVVADGIGGHTAGKEASDLAARVVMRQYYADPSADVEGSLVQAIQVANAEIHRLAQDPAFARMGTTIVAAVVRGNQLTVAHVGDSRVYLDRGGAMRPLTRDHTWVAEQVQNGLLTPEQAAQHEQRHVLTRSLGRLAQVVVDVSHHTLQPGDRLLLCSDGLWEFVDHGLIQQVLATQPAQVAAQQLVDLANQAGGPDNITAIVVRPAVAAGSAVRPARAGAGGRPWDQARAWFTALPGDRQRLVLVVGVALVLFACVILAIFQFSRPLPEAPSPVVEPLRYIAREGDTPAAIAAYLHVGTADIPADVSTGRTLELKPGGYAIHFSGQVLQMQEEGTGGLVLEVGGRDKRYRVRVDPDVGVMLIREPYAPEKGNTVAVIGHPGGDDTVDALGVDVADGRTWHTWYRRSLGPDLWIYSAVHDHLIPAEDDLAGAEGRPILFLGNWVSTDTSLLFDWDPADLYWLGEDAEPAIYVPAVPGAASQPLSTRFPSVSPSALAITGEPGEAATAVPPATPGPEGTVTGTVLPQVGVNVRAEATSTSTIVGSYLQGAQFPIECKVAGEEFEGNTTWYRLSDPGFGTGYVFAGNIGLDPGYTEEAVTVCE